MVEAIIAVLGGPGGVGALLGAVLLFFFRAVFKDKADAKEKLFKTGVEVAYNIVNDVAARTQNKVDDKIALGLKALKDFMALNGQSVSPVDEEKAKLLFQAMHGAKKE
jgi:hypothetical protein